MSFCSRENFVNGIFPDNNCYFFLKTRTETMSAHKYLQAYNIGNIYHTSLLGVFGLVFRCFKIIKPKLTNTYIVLYLNTFSRVSKIRAYDTIHIGRR